jgi:D-galacturonate reductase
MEPINIVIIGAGMYVCGRGTNGYGTIMPAILEWKRRNLIGRVCIAATSPKSVTIARRKIGELQRKSGVEIAIDYFPNGNRPDRECYKKAIDSISKPAACIIAVPDKLHKKFAITSMEKGLHTFIVKPLVPTLKEAHELINIQKKKKVYCAVDFHKRLDLANIKLKDAISQGLIGDPLYFVVEYSQRKSMPTRIFKKWVEETNVFQYLGIHYIDIIFFSTKATPKRAMAIGQKNWLYSKDINAYDSIQAIVEWEMPSGKRFNSIIVTNWIDPERSSAMSNQAIKVVGTKGRFESDQKRRGIMIVTDDKGTEEPNPYFCSSCDRHSGISYQGYGIDSINQFLDDVVKIEKIEIGVRDLENKRPTFRESIVPTAVLECVNKSLKHNGRWIEVKGI